MSTIRDELNALKRGLNLAVRAGLLAHRPAFPTIELRNTRLIATAVTQQRIERTRAIEVVLALQSRPDIWISQALCEKVLQALRVG